MASMLSNKVHLYRYFDSIDRLLYVGVTQNLRQRGYNHKYESAWYSDVARMESVPYERRSDALKAETKAIQSESPLYNKQTSSLSNNAIVRLDQELIALAKASIHKGIKLGKLHEKDNLSSVVRMLLRKFIRISAKW
jgi:excinuclease UvrABC nuclease subunit